jgi:hypothetical protein
MVIARIFKVSKFRNFIDIKNRQIKIFYSAIVANIADLSICRITIPACFLVYYLYIFIYIFFPSSNNQIIKLP